MTTSENEMTCPVPTHRHDTMLGCRQECENCLAIYDAEVGHPYDPTDPVNNHGFDLDESFHGWEPGDRIPNGAVA